MHKRRDFLRTATALAAAGPTLLPDIIRRALAIPAASPTGTIQDVQHVVILMQENRSFDHYFGTFRGARGFGDPRPTPIYRDGGKPRPDPIWRQPSGPQTNAQHPDGHILPYPLHPQPVPQPVCFADLPHDWKSGHNAFNRGRNDGWPAAKSSHTMAYYQGADLPFHWALADAFTLCDAYHCSVIGPTHPNRLYLMTGSNGPADGEYGARVSNSDKRYEFAWTTYPERLQAAGISWQLYQNSLINNGKEPFGANNYGCNALQWFKPYDHVANAQSPLVTRGNAVRTLEDLRKDVVEGKLAQVSYIVPPEGFSEHPQFPPAYGAAYIAQLIKALTADPQVWSRTVLLIMYDENDGFFDHVVPPAPPAANGVGGVSTVATADEVFKDGHAFGLGVRVPMIVVSPWSRGGWMCSQTFDHTSVIRFLEARFGVHEPNITAWRRAVCGDLTTAFDFSQPNAAAMQLPDAVLGDHPSTKTVSLPPVPGTQAMPTAIAGTRPARALPYELSVDGSADAAQRRFSLKFTNHGAAAAVFQVYSAKAGDEPRFFTVEAGKQLADEWICAPDGAAPYELTVYGPNGFMRCFRGDLARAGTAQPEVQVRHDAAGGAVVLTLRNPGKAACAVSVVRNAYGEPSPRAHPLAPGAMVEDRWPLAASTGWYDLTVTCAEVPGFLRRCAGRVEDGKPGITDPAMGGVIPAAPFDPTA